MEVARAHALPIESLRLGWSGYGRLPGSHHRKRAKGTTPLHQLAIGAECYFLARAGGAEVPDHRDLVGMRIRQRLEQNGIHCTEDGCAGAYSESQREDSNQREAWFL